MSVKQELRCYFTAYKEQTTTEGCCGELERKVIAYSESGEIRLLSQASTPSAESSSSDQTMSHVGMISCQVGTNFLFQFSDGSRDFRLLKITLALGTYSI